MAGCRKSNEANAWLARLGFLEVGRNLDSILDLSTYRQPVDYNEVLQRVTDQGIEIRTHAEIEDQKRERKLWELEINADMPSPHTYRRSSFELWRAKMVNPAHREDAIWLPLDGRSFVGITELRFRNGLTENATLPIT